ncbi:type I-E CRISPR-associated protein Cas6/Cse3/CasE [Nocardiopsis sp. HNM0947]|uniref:Type I-E CRISPR-associated protein Cas6/Cse3/CasE n=1 Tax=Nocardiopsis coralli TaxID=2772213 RepID=A0ABR9P4A4_9ACTN|nr:type I-E CRISPR-associated protein Cas6/Cse3/CasE [Nocardiopsis coralli]MBE2998647.1 type I-E CRISPR-associated protein Cas6/Cse3/CasE [Nocardiopsis coralli]
MYLSRLRPSIRSRAYRRDHADVQHMHRTLMSAFPEVDADGSARKENGLLWRLDRSDAGHMLLVQSAVEPDWAQLPDDYLAAPAETRSMAAVFEAIVPGRELAFRCTANPTRIVRDPKAPKFERGRRVALHDEKSRLGWIARKGEQHGFEIPATHDGALAVDVVPLPPAIGYKGTSSRRSKITVSPAQFDGRLVVTDADAFAEAVRTGIGRAKAYGCGLLSLAPVPFV